MCPLGTLKNALSSNPQRPKLTHDEPWQKAGFHFTEARLAQITIHDYVNLFSSGIRKVVIDRSACCQWYIDIEPVERC